MSGPNLKKKLSTAVINLRFDNKLFCYDIQKAFLQLALPVHDQNRLCFLWYSNVDKGDYSVVGYRSKRLPFGLRCSLSLLMLSLYFILIRDQTENNSSEISILKRKLYHFFYMDNGAASANTSAELFKIYNKIESIYNPFKFSIQQIITNDLDLQSIIDQNSGSVTPVNCKLLGLN